TQVLTPAYASPEQVEGAPLTTAADVWALGVVLYELLAGQRPHQALDGHRLGEAILSGAIEPPSRRARRVAQDTQADAADTTNPRPRLPPVRIPADVDAIVLKALRRDPQARYASVAAMAEDIRRFL
ncbi:protein kinase, partial [Xanthomonas sp. XNM01]|uniref:protein kinase domain-containing protein n=1 Tax=Xanthomonas sp. XNM01 TaxID=2769289 RepID=UPI00177BA1A7